MPSPLHCSAESSNCNHSKAHRAFGARSARSLERVKCSSRFWDFNFSIQLIAFIRGPCPAAPVFHFRSRLARNGTSVPAADGRSRLSPVQHRRIDITIVQLQIGDRRGCRLIRMYRFLHAHCRWRTLGYCALVRVFDDGGSLGSNPVGRTGRGIGFARARRLVDRCPPVRQKTHQNSRRVDHRTITLKSDPKANHLVHQQTPFQGCYPAASGAQSAKETKEQPRK